MWRSVKIPLQTVSVPVHAVWFPSMTHLAVCLPSKKNPLEHLFKQVSPNSGTHGINTEPCSGIPIAGHDFPIKV